MPVQCKVWFLPLLPLPSPAFLPASLLGSIVRVTSLLARVVYQVVRYLDQAQDSRALGSSPLAHLAPLDRSCAGRWFPAAVRFLPGVLSRTLWSASFLCCFLLLAQLCTSSRIVPAIPAGGAVPPKNLIIIIIIRPNVHSPVRPRARPP